MKTTMTMTEYVTVRRLAGASVEQPLLCLARLANLKANLKCPHRSELS